MKNLKDEIKQNILNTIFNKVSVNKIKSLHLIKISKEVNMSRNALYYHFKGYQDLIYELFNYANNYFNLNFINNLHYLNLLNDNSFINFYYNFNLMINLDDLIYIYLLALKRNNDVNSLNILLIKLKIAYFFNVIKLIKESKNNKEIDNLKIYLLKKEDPISRTFN